MKNVTGIGNGTMKNLRVKVKDKVTSTPPGKWGRIGAGVLVGGVAFGWLIFPFLLDKVIASQINLSQGKDSRKLWTQLPTLDCYMYLFNITNPAQVMRGEKPRLQEIGPYCYKEIKDKINLVEDPNTDTISYSARTTWYENQRDPKCPGQHLTGEEMLVLPNIPLLAILLIGEKDFPPAMMSLVNQALPDIFGRFSDVFMRVSARRVLFDGVSINCSARALYPRAVCIALKQNSRALKKLGNNQYEFSFFGAKNHTPEEFRYTVKRGTEDVQEIGRLVAVDGRPELPFWRGDCNKIQGTDSTVFPPFRQKENGSLAAYSSEVCRIILGVYEGEYDYKGVTGYAYSASLGDTENNPGDRCFCPADDRCRKRGVLDSLKCQGAPIVASQPHFYMGNPDYVNGVEGLSPTKEKHGLLIVLEPTSGSPLVVRKRLQFNIDLKPISYIPITQRLRRTLVPLVWAEELLDLDSDLMGVLESSLFLPIRAVDVIKWMCIVLGVGIGVGAVILKYRKYKRDKVHVINHDQEANGLSDFPKPKETVKLEDFKENQNYDPFYVHANELSEKFVENGISTNSLKKGNPTVHSGSGAKVINKERSTSRPNIIDRTNLTKSMQFEEDQLPVYVISKDNNYNKSLNISHGNDFIDSFRSISNSSQGETNQTLAIDGTLDVDSALAKVQDTSHTKSLELQISTGGLSNPMPLNVMNLPNGNQLFKTNSGSTYFDSDPFFPDQTHVRSSQILSSDTKESNVERISNVDINKNSTLNDSEFKYFDVSEVFGEPINQTNSTEVTDKILTPKTEISEQNFPEPIGNGLNTNNNLVEEKAKEIIIASSQEIKEVEDDIKNLKAEIAKLIPKK